MKKEKEHSQVLKNTNLRADHLQNSQDAVCFRESGGEGLSSKMERYIGSATCYLCLFGQYFETFGATEALTLNACRVDFWATFIMKLTINV